MGDPGKTGISRITGKVVYIRHATDFERTDVAAMLKLNGPHSGLSAADVVVASQDDRIIGYAVMTPPRSPSGSVCLAFREGRRFRGIGKQVLRHLLAHQAVKSIETDSDSGRYLRSMGYLRQSDRRPRQFLQEGGCEGLGGRAVHRYERSGRHSAPEKEAGHGKRTLGRGNGDKVVLR